MRQLLRKQITEAKEGPSELRREKSKVNITCLGEEDGERKGLGVLS